MWPKLTAVGECAAYRAVVRPPKSRLDVGWSKGGRCEMTKTLTRIAAALGSLLALLVAGGAPFRA